MNSIAKMGVGLTNISNLINDIGVENLDIKVFTKGDAIKAFMRNTNEFAPLIQDLAEKKVKFSVCAIAMSNLTLEENDLLEFVTVDSYYSSEIVKNKIAGWSTTMLNNNYLSDEAVRALNQILQRHHS